MLLAQGGTLARYNYLPLVLIPGGLDIKGHGGLKTYDAWGKVNSLGKDGGALRVGLDV